MILNLDRNEWILTAYAANHSGPGWSNQTWTVVIKNTATGQLREQYLQPEEWTKSQTLSILLKTSTALNEEVVQALENGR